MIKRLLQDSQKAIRALATGTIVILCDGIPYRFEKVPVKKILNWIRVEASIKVKPQKPWGFPTHLQIEPGNGCNLNCALCPVTTGMKRESGQMELELFKKTIDETGDYVFLILLWDWGEPFLNPHIYEMIAYARERGIKIVSSSNGHLFAQAEHAKKVVQSGLDTLIFAMDGITQESYERYRCGGNLATVLEGIRQVVSHKRAVGSSTPLVNLRFIVMKDNEHEIPAVKELARSIGVDVLTFKTLNPSFEYGVTLDQDNEFIPEEKRYRRFSYDDEDHQRLRVKNNPCKNLWNCAVIHWNGIICPCSFDPDEKYVLGDQRSDTMRNNWSGEPYRRMRESFRRKWEDIPLCRDCSYAYRGGSCYNETIAEAIFFNQGDDKITRLPE